MLEDKNTEFKSEYVEDIKKTFFADLLPPKSQLGW